jgi:hypothetical protein
MKYVVAFRTGPGPIVWLDSYGDWFRDEAKRHLFNSSQAAMTAIEKDTLYNEIKVEDGVPQTPLSYGVLGVE